MCIYRKMTKTSTSNVNKNETAIPDIIVAPTIQPITSEQVTTQMSDDSFEKHVKPLMVKCVKEIEIAAKHVIRALLESEKAIGHESLFKEYKKNLEHLGKLEVEISAQNDEAKKKNLNEKKSALIAQKEKFENEHFKTVGTYIHATIDDTLIITPNDKSIFLDLKDSPNFYYSGSKDRKGGHGVELVSTQQFVGTFNDDHRDSGVIFFDKDKSKYYVGDFQKQNLGYGCYSQDGKSFEFAEFKTQKDNFPNITIQLVEKPGEKPLVRYNESANKEVAFSDTQKDYLIGELKNLREGALAQVLKKVTDNTDRWKHFTKLDTDFGKGVGYGLGAAAVALGAYGAYKGIKYWMKSKKSKEKLDSEARSQIEAAPSLSNNEAKIGAEASSNDAVQSTSGMGQSAQQKKPRGRPKGSVKKRQVEASQSEVQPTASSNDVALSTSGTGEASQLEVQQKKPRGRPKGSVKKRRGRPPRRSTSKKVSMEKMNEVREIVSVKDEKPSEGTRKSPRLSNR